MVARGQAQGLPLSFGGRLSTNPVLCPPPEPEVRGTVLAARRCGTADDGRSSNVVVQSGFSHGDDAFDAVVGPFGVLQVCLGQREPGEPDDRAILEIA